MKLNFIKSVAPEQMDGLAQVADEAAPAAVVFPAGLTSTEFFPNVEDRTGQLVLEPGDGPASSIVRSSVKILGYGGALDGMPAEAIGQLDGDLYVTSCRLVLIGRNFDHGVGAPLSLVKGATALTAKMRSKHRFIGVQVRYPFLKAVAIQNHIRFSAGEGLLKRKNALRVLSYSNDGQHLFHFATPDAKAVALALLERAEVDKLGIGGITDEQAAQVSEACKLGGATIAAAADGVYAGSPTIPGAARRRRFAYLGSWSSKNFASDPG